MYKKLATAEGRYYAEKKYRQRLRKNKQNCSLYNGLKNNKSPNGTEIIFFCKFCHSLSDIMATDDYCAIPRVICDECESMKKLNWLKEIA